MSADGVGEFLDGGVELVRRDDAIDQSPCKSLLGRDGFAGQQHFQGARGGMARTSGTIGVVQNRPILTPGVANVAVRRRRPDHRRRRADSRPPSPVPARARSPAAAAPQCCITREQNENSS